MIERCRNDYPVRLMCHHLPVSASGYYDWRSHQSSNRSITNARLKQLIATIHAESDGVMGAPRIHRELCYQREICSKNRLARLMTQLNLQGIPQKRQWRKKGSTARPEGIEPPLRRNFSAQAPNQKWVTDITYIRTGEGWLYLTVVLDCCTDEGVGWSMSPQQTRDRVIQAVLMAIGKRPNKQPVYLHSDRGSPHPLLNRNEWIINKPSLR